MNWNDGDLSLVDGMFYKGEKYLGTFSSHEAGLAAIYYMRWYKIGLSDPKIMTDSDIDLMEAIDADES